MKKKQNNPPKAPLSDEKDLAWIKDLVAGLIRRHGPRLAGSRGCLATARELKEQFLTVCDRSWLQPFVQHPDSFWLIPALCAGAYSLAALLWFSGLHFVYPLAVLSAGLVFGMTQFFFLGGFFDFMFPRRQGTNVVGLIEPARPAERQLLVCAHHDSAKRIRFLEGPQILYPLQMIGAMVFFLLTSLALLLEALLAQLGRSALSAALSWLFAGGAVFVIPFFFFYRRQGSPGAGDNLLACVLLVRLAQKIRTAGGLTRTRLILVSHDGEEIGMRGAHAFVREYPELLREYPLTVINLDSLHRMADLTLLSSDRNGTVRLSRKLQAYLQKLWGGMGYDVKCKRLPAGGGGTDAAVYAAAGWETASLIAISTAMIRSGLVYHTERDDVTRLDDRVVVAGLDLMLRTLQSLDREEIPRG